MMLNIYVKKELTDHICSDYLYNICNTNIQILLLYLFQIEWLFLNERNSTIDMNQVKDLYSTSDFHKNASNSNMAKEIDDLKIFQSIFSKHFPPERYNGIINLLYIFRYKNSTSEEIENALVGFILKFTMCIPFP